MNKTWLMALLGALLVASCVADQYVVTGSSNVQGLEGKMLYLKVFADDDLRAIDSSRVVHGKFNFRGAMDSVVMATLFVEEMSLMPIVLEDGKIVVRIDETVQSVSGTALNDSLSSFIQKKTQIDARIAELSHVETRMIMDGIDHDQIIIELGQQASELEAESDELVSRFIRTNYNNVLGHGIFMVMTSGLRYPVMNPQIEAIISQAPPYFLGHPYVKEYIRAAEENMEKLREY